MERVGIRVRGIVQGVGFRPFVYKLALRLGINGHVLNDSAGLLVEAEAERSVLDDFVQGLRAEHPPLAWVQELTITSLPLGGETGFTIRHSIAETGKFALVSSDVATCAECLAEIRDPANRRYRYPFTNCTNCGPRYTIIRDIPYDRPNTTMAVFAMCAAVPCGVRRPRRPEVPRAAQCMRGMWSGALRRNSRSAAALGGRRNPGDQRARRLPSGLRCTECRSGRGVTESEAPK